MRERGLLSPETKRYITEQHTLYKKSHVPMLRRRMKTLFEDIFIHTITPVLQSNALKQSFKDELFSDIVIENFLKDLVKYDYQNTSSEEENKQKIAKAMLSHSLSYFKQRYKETIFIQKQIEDFESIVLGLVQISERQTEEEESLAFYKIRGSAKLPPLIKRDKNTVTSLCRICWEHCSMSINKRNMEFVTQESIKGIRHTKHCRYDKKQIDRCIEVIVL